MKKVLVTGGLGFIGSHTVVELQEKGYEVVIIDDLSNSSMDVLGGITAITGKTQRYGLHRNVGIQRGLEDTCMK